MVRNLSFDLVEDIGWQASNDYFPLSLEAAMYTEGRLHFLHDGSAETMKVYLLEFYLEIQTAILTNFGSHQFEEHMHLPFSAHRLHFRLERGEVSLRDSGKILMRQDWTIFMIDFQNFRSMLRENMERCFPQMAASPEFKIVF